VTLDNLTTVWDREVWGLRGALKDAASNSNVLILLDSQVAIAAVRKAGRISKARTVDVIGDANSSTAGRLTQSILSTE